MKKLILNFVLLTALSSSPLFSQEGNPLLDALIKKGEELIDPEKKQKKKAPAVSKQAPMTVSKKTPQQKPTNSIIGEPLVIPVVFHVVHKNYPTKNLNKPLFDALLLSMNQGFNTIEYGVIDKDYWSISDIPNIKFKYASELLGCAIVDDITYHDTDQDEFEFYHIQQNEQEGEYDPLLKNHGYKDSKRILNIWICQLKGEGNTGYSTYPQETNPLNDGIVLDIEVLKASNKEFKKVAVSHELGHYFGLYHIWGKGLEGFGCNPIGGDKIDDTPPQAKRNTYKRVMNADIEKVCLSLKLSNYQNFMDYSFLGGMFTKDQVVRMRERITQYRMGLLSKKCPVSVAQTVSTGNNSPKSGVFTDTRDGQKYKWVQIGSQKWMAENLNFASQYSYCYDNNPENCKKYGRLYNWEEAIVACPPGWRLSNQNDWDQLRAAVLYNQDHIKSVGQWPVNKNGNNKSGLNILPAGYDQNVISNKYVGLGRVAKFWLSNSSVFGYSRTIDGENDQIPHAGSSNKKELLSCRCVED